MANTEELQKRIYELEKEVEKLNLIIQKDSETKYGLRWIDVPEAFEKESEHKIPVLEEVKEKAVITDDQKPSHILIEGDNYHALKCLNYTHKGKIDVIYIDPPYNTETEGFIYRDKRVMDEFPNGREIDINHPLRHSAWLSLMSKRLELAKNLLSKEGLIFISIDYNEFANLKLLCDKVFGQSCYVGLIDWESKTKSQNTKTAYDKLQPKVEHILVYEKLSHRHFNLISKGQKDYDKTDDDGVYREYIMEQMSASGVRGRETMIFDVSVGDETVTLPPGKQWKFGEDLVNFYKEKKDLFIKDGKVVIKMRPEYERNDITEPFWGFISKEIGTAESAKKELTEIVHNHNFETVKPVALVQKLLFHASNKNSIILDFFAGSGTTLQALMKLNELDKGCRQGILVQENFNNICEDITYQRNKKVIEGYKNLKNEDIPGIGNSLKYYRTAFVGENEADSATDTDKIILAKKAGCLLSIAENTLYEIESTDFYQIFTDKRKNYTGVYFSSDTEEMVEFTEKLEELRNKNRLNKISAYFFGWGSGEEYENEFSSMRSISIKTIPEPILKVYQTLNV